MTVDAAFARFRELKATILPEDQRSIDDNDASTRVCLIDPMLFDVLGWSKQQGAFEVIAGNGRLDYAIRDANDACWLVVEAKKRDVDLVSRDGSFGRFLLGGTVLKDLLPIIDTQMSPYLGRFMPYYGVLTNGEQWIGFLGKTRPAELRLERSQAVVFRSLEEVEDEFERFYDFFSHERASARVLHRFLLPDAARGLASGAGSKRVVSVDAEKPLAYQANEPFYRDLRTHSLQRQNVNG